MYSFQFFLLCLSSAFFFSSFNLIIMELPAYLSSLGGEDYKGLIIALFTLTAGLSRPFSGKLTDTIGRMPVMIFGAVICFVCGFIYPVVTSVAGFLFLRFVHGLSTGFKPTATAAFVADVVPADRRGEAMGILGVFGNLGMAGGPALGSYIALNYSYDAMFYMSSILAILSVAILFKMKETLETPQKFTVFLLRVDRNDVYEPSVVPAAIVMLFGVYGFGVILTLIPDYSVLFGIENKGIYMTYLTVASFSTRFFAGKASDIYGRVPVLKIGLAIITLSMIYTGYVSSDTELYMAGFITGIGFGMTSPTIFAWTIDLSPENVRGRAMATLYIALEIGIGSGALLSAWIYGNNSEMFKFAFLSVSFLAFIAIGYLYYYEHKLKKVYAERHL